MSGTEQIQDDDAVTVEDLRALLARERDGRQAEAVRAVAAEQARERAERERDEARGSAVTEVAARFYAEEQAVESQIGSTNATAEQLTERIAVLNQEGDYAGAAKAHRELARAEANLTALQARKDGIAQQKAYQEHQARHAATQQPQQGGGQQYSPRQRAWIEKNPLYMTDSQEGQRFRLRVAAAHNLAVADGVQIDSDDYFERINDGVADRREAREADTYGAENDDAGLPPPRRSAQAMPVTRRQAAPSGRGGAVVRLSPEMREMADIALPDTPVEDYVDNGVTRPGRYRLYAQNASILKQQGRM